MKNLVLCVPILSIGLLAGCETPQYHAERIGLADRDASVLTYPASLRGAYFLDRDTETKFCAEPSPDVALASLQEFAAKLTLSLPRTVDASGEVAGRVVAEVAALAGRSQTLLLAREMLYRACELALNDPDLPSEDRKQLYDSVISLVRDLGQAELQRAQADALRQAEAARKAGVVIDEILGTEQ